MSIRPLPTVAHTIALNVLVYGYVKLQNMDTPTDTWIRTQKGGHWQFLTVQALVTAIITFGLSLTADLLPKNKGVVRAKRLTTMVSLPIASAVSSIYWSLIFFAPDLILPPAKPSPGQSASPINLAWIPLHVDLIVHLMPAVFLVLDFYLLENKFGSEDVGKWAPAMLMVFALWYSGWVEYLNLFNHRFPYPFLDVAPQFRASIYLGALLLGYMSFRNLNSLHRGKSLLGNVEVVQVVVEPERPKDLKTL
ncbi:hypothetical protein DL93DRAFT_2157349 [Clavulina sp. PMI_390]|nr:hypothetical protein DL93DRAFT_2157349 [Clavulina sp. PMI_390]